MNDMPPETTAPIEEDMLITFISKGSQVKINAAGDLLIQRIAPIYYIPQEEDIDDIVAAIKAIATPGIIRHSDLQTDERSAIIKNNDNQKYIIAELQAAGALTDDNYKRADHLEALKNIEPSQNKQH
jgi:hypothetical protein